MFCYYNYSGREFKALFISTVECVHDGFQSANPTKSFCNRYVFNTALTRAQSLVVVAGNPFLLLKVEAAMPMPMGCWREYLRRCMDHNTFIVPKEICNGDVNVVEKLRRQLVEPVKGNELIQSLLLYKESVLLTCTCTQVGQPLVLLQE